MRDQRRDQKPSPGASDAELVYSVRAGNLQAREGLFHRHVHFVYALAQGLVGHHSSPQVVSEESFRLAFQLLRDRRSAVSNDLVHPEAWRPWLAGVVVRVGHQAIYRQLWQARFFPLALIRRHSSPTSVLDRLPLNVRAAHILHTQGQLTPPEIAIALDVSTRRVLRYLSQAAARLDLS